MTTGLPVGGFSVAGPATVRAAILSVHLPPEVNRVLYVTNLRPTITGEQLYSLFGPFGAIRQIRIGNTEDTLGQAFVIYEDIYDAKKALDRLAGSKIGKGRFLGVQYYDPEHAAKVQERKRKRKEVEQEFKEHLKQHVNES